MRASAGWTETHFVVRVVSDAFCGKSAVQRHRMVYGLIGDELQSNGLHAVRIEARTPDEFARRAQ